MQDTTIRTEVAEFLDIEQRREALLVALTTNDGTLPKRLQALDQICSGAISGLLKSGDFSGKKDQSIILYSNEKGPARICLVGLGEESSVSDESIRRSVHTGVRMLASVNLESVGIDLKSFCANGITCTRVTEIVAETVHMALWRYLEFKTKEIEISVRKISTVQLLRPAEDTNNDLSSMAERSTIIAQATNYARTLVSMPSNELYPATLAKEARQLADRHGYGIRIIEEDEMKELGLNGHLAVGSGSVHRPCLIIIDTKPDSQDPPLALVGKGITFDSGGISIKPAKDMYEMKGDMAGAAVVLGALDALGGTGYQGRLLGAIPAAENLTGEKAQRPGDIIRMHNGITVEVLNTDAEGRLVLADAMSFVNETYHPVAMVDIATLTGAITVALGSNAIGLFSNDDELCAALARAGELTYERVWRMPLYEEYFEQIKSEAADIQNTGGREAGSITAAAFLKSFTGSTPWAHLDIAGVAWASRERWYVPKGPTGIGVRLVTEMIDRQISPEVISAWAFSRKNNA